MRINISSFTVMHSTKIQYIYNITKLIIQHTQYCHFSTSEVFQSKYTIGRHM